LDGHEIGKYPIVPGQFEVSAPLPDRHATQRRIDLAFSQSQVLSAVDGRTVGARLDFLGFVPSSEIRDIVRSPGIQLETGWGALETFNEENFRWVGNDALVTIQSAHSTATLSLLLEPGPGVEGKGFVLKILDPNGNVVAAQFVQGRMTVRLVLPTHVGAENRFVLHIDGGGKQVPTDPRVLNFRVFKAELA
jgi:hypothetical protein